MTQKRKRVARFRYDGLGFPLELRNVDLVRFRDAWAPDVKLNELSSHAFLALATKPATLTGAEVRFVRQRMRLTLEGFAGRLRVTHQAVMKWERAGDEATGMIWGTEVALRLEILNATLVDSPRKFLKTYLVIAGMPLGSPEGVVMVHDPTDPAFLCAGYAAPSRGPARTRLSRATRKRGRSGSHQTS